MEWILIALISIGANVWQYGESEKLQQQLDEVSRERVQCEKINSENQTALARRDNEIRKARENYTEQLRQLDSVVAGGGADCLLQTVPDDLQRIIHSATGEPA